MNAEADRGRVRDELLLATLPHIAFEGWTDRALRAGIADRGLTAAEGELAFRGGAPEMIAHWSAWSDGRMLALLDEVDPKAMTERERLSFVMRARLETNVPYREAVRRTLAYLALPIHADLSARLAWRAADAISYAAGDRLTGFGFYTRRGLLAGAYAATVLFWLDDDSEAFVETWAFLDRRIDDLSRLPQPMAVLARLGQRLPTPTRLFRRAFW